MAEVLSKAGYATAFYGKSHLGDIESCYLNNQGYDEAFWTPYNQVPSLYIPELERAGAIRPGSLNDNILLEDPYDIDKGWKPKGYVWALEGKKTDQSVSGVRPPTLPLASRVASSATGKMPRRVSKNEFYDLYTDPRERTGEMIEQFHVKSMFNRQRHELWIKKYPNRPDATPGSALTGIDNVRPDTKEIYTAQVEEKKLPLTGFSLACIQAVPLSATFFQQPVRGS